MQWGAEACIFVEKTVCFSTEVGVDSGKQIAQSCGKLILRFHQHERIFHKNVRTSAKCGMSERKCNILAKLDSLNEKRCRLHTLHRPSSAEPAGLQCLCTMQVLLKIVVPL
jgi:hypothetical protein